MAQYFSSAPIDLGGNILSRAYSDANQAIIQGLGLYGKRKEAEADRVQQAKMVELQEKVRAKAAEDAAQRELDSYFTRNSAGEGLAPVVSADGKIDRVATGALIKAAQRASELARRKDVLTQDRDLNLSFKAEELGVGAKPGMTGMAAPAPARQPMGGINQFASPELRGKLDGSEAAGMAVGQPAPVSLARQIAEAEMAQRVDMAGKESAARAKAADPYGDNFVQGDNYAVNGNYVGRAVRDKRTGDYGIKGSDGKLAPLPEGAQPITATAINKNIVSANDFKKFKTDLTDSERSLRQFERYANSVGGLDQGVASLADRVTGGFKTLIGSGKLTQDELSRAAASGQLQGLLGGNRVSVVGGGVLTEQDAARIIQRLGGDVGALQNREVVMKALGELYQDRFAQYQDDFNFYNEAVDSYWGAKGFKRAPETDFNKLFGASPAVNGNVAAPAAPAISDFAAAAKAELARRKGQ